MPPARSRPCSMAITSTPVRRDVGMAFFFVTLVHCLYMFNLHNLSKSYTKIIQNCLYQTYPKIPQPSPFGSVNGEPSVGVFCRSPGDVCLRHGGRLWLLLRLLHALGIFESNFLGLGGWNLKGHEFKMISLELRHD